MARISDQTRERNQAALRAAMDRLLAGHIPPGSRVDLKTLAAEAGIARTGFYPKGERPGPYQHLAEEFTRRLAAKVEAGEIVDRRDAQIVRLRARVDELQQRAAQLDESVQELTAFKNLALSRLAAQHAEIQHLRSDPPIPDNVRALRAAPLRPQRGGDSRPSQG